MQGQTIRIRYCLCKLGSRVQLDRKGKKKKKKKDKAEADCARKGHLQKEANTPNCAKAGHMQKRENKSECARKDINQHSTQGPKKTKLKVCRYCHMAGHIQKDCYRYKYNIKPKNLLDGRDTVKGSDNTIFYCLASYSGADNVEDDCWYFDSGCSRNMTCVREYLIKIRLEDT